MVLISHVALVAAVSEGNVELYVVLWRLSIPMIAEAVGKLLWVRVICAWLAVASNKPANKSICLFIRLFFSEIIGIARYYKKIIYSGAYCVLYKGF